jgi:hypothetical protein
MVVMRGERRRRAARALGQGHGGREQVKARDLVFWEAPSSEWHLARQW